VVPIDDDVRERAVKAVLDGGMTQVAVCRQHKVSKHHLGRWLREERDRRSKETDVPDRAQESSEERLDRLTREWGGPDLYPAQIVSGIKAAERTRKMLRYLLCAPLWLCAFILCCCVVAIFLIAFIQVSTSVTWRNLGLLVIAAIVCWFLVLIIWWLTQFFVNLIFKLCAPFAYAVTHLQAALKQLQVNRAEFFQDPQSSEEEISRKQIIKKIGRAAHILDVTRRRGRTVGSPISRSNEREARRKVAAYLAKSEDLLWSGGCPGRLKAIEILEVAVYETVLRKWNLEDFKDVVAAPPSSFWQRRLRPLLKGTAPFGAVAASLIWQVWGPADQTPGHFIREFLGRYN
jgi:transposase-like protein